jgi:alkyldihydroxyacetonephosphate synthase
VVFPKDHDEVEALVREADLRGVVIIPFGGGTNIVGCVNPQADAECMVVSLDMRDMNRLLSVDENSLTAVIQAGALGPKLEEDLVERGFSLGHYPDSFEYSTLGGWLATRSAGMQSDAYGKIEDMVVALRMATPIGTLVTKPRPRAATGPDLNQMVLGSEGVLGVITEATMRIHRDPEVKAYHGFLFRTFEDGFRAMRECVASSFPPSMFRLSDTGETELAMKMKSPSTGLRGWLHRQVRRFLASRGYGSPCLMLAGFEGSRRKVSRTRTGAFRILRRHGGFHLGAGVGRSWSKEKFHLPYLRDFIMDHSCVVDVGETSTVWSNVLPLHGAVHRAMQEAFAREGSPGYMGCHISHTYATGACLYFTFATQQASGRELEQYYGLKRTITDAIVDNGGTLSHHHAVGTEHLKWMRREVTEPGVRALRGVKNALDPKGIMNPGKLIPD